VHSAPQKKREPNYQARRAADKGAVQREAAAYPKG